MKPHTNEFIIVCYTLFVILHHKKHYQNISPHIFLANPAHTHFHINVSTPANRCPQPAPVPTTTNILPTSGIWQVHQKHAHFTKDFPSKLWIFHLFLWQFHHMIATQFCTCKNFEQPDSKNLNIAKFTFCQIWIMNKKNQLKWALEVHQAHDPVCFKTNIIIGHYARIKSVLLYQH